MTVEELIEKLKTLPGHYDVVILRSEIETIYLVASLNHVELDASRKEVSLEPGFFKHKI
jgi:hypothetical protein